MQAVARSIAAGAKAYLHSRITHQALTGTEGFADAWALAAAVPGWFSETSASLFWSYIADRQPTTVVEIGSFMGRSTCLIGLALKRFSSSPRLTAIDPHTGDKQNLEQLGSGSIPTLAMFEQYTSAVGVRDIIDVEVMTSVDAAASWGGTPLDLLFVDGWHTYDAVRSDIENWAALLTGSGAVCFDDVRSYPEVRSAVIDGCRALGLQIWGEASGQAWAGRADPPEGLASALKTAGAANRILTEIARLR